MRGLSHPGRKHLIPELASLALIVIEDKASRATAASCFKFDYPRLRSRFGYGMPWFILHCREVDFSLHVLDAVSEHVSGLRSKQCSPNAENPNLNQHQFPICGTPRDCGDFLWPSSAHRGAPGALMGDYRFRLFLQRSGFSAEPGRRKIEFTLERPVECGL